MRQTTLSVKDGKAVLKPHSVSCSSSLVAYMSIDRITLLFEFLCLETLDI